MVEQRNIYVQIFISLLNLRSKIWIQFYQNLTVCYSIARLGRNNHIHIHSIYQETSLYGFLCKTRFKWPCDKNMENFLITKIKFLEKNPKKNKKNVLYTYVVLLLYGNLHTSSSSFPFFSLSLFLPFLLDLVLDLSDPVVKTFFISYEFFELQIFSRLNLTINCLLTLPRYTLGKGVVIARSNAPF